MSLSALLFHSLPPARAMSLLPSRPPPPSPIPHETDAVKDDDEQEEGGRKGKGGGEGERTICSACPSISEGATISIVSGSNPIAPDV